MLKSVICEMLGIKYPVFQGGMAWISDGKLAAAVSDAGGLGIIASGNAPGDYVREQIRIAKDLTDKPIGVNIMLLSPYADDIAKIVIEEKVNVVTTGAGNPSKYPRCGIGCNGQTYDKNRCMCTNCRRRRKRRSCRRTYHNGASPPNM